MNQDFSNLPDCRNSEANIHVLNSAGFRLYYGRMAKIHSPSSRKRLVAAMFYDRIYNDFRRNNWRANKSEVIDASRFPVGPQTRIKSSRDRNCGSLRNPNWRNAYMNNDFHLKITTRYDPFRTQEPNRKSEPSPAYFSGKSMILQHTIRVPPLALHLFRAVAVPERVSNPYREPIWTWLPKSWCGLIRLFTERNHTVGLHILIGSECIAALEVAVAATAGAKVLRYLKKS